MFYETSYIHSANRATSFVEHLLSIKNGSLLVERKMNHLNTIKGKRGLIQAKTTQKFVYSRKNKLTCRIMRITYTSKGSQQHVASLRQTMTTTIN